MARWTTVWEKESGKPFRCMGADVVELTVDNEKTGVEAFYTANKPEGAEDAKPHRGEVIKDKTKDSQDLHTYSVKQLRVFAEENGISNSDKMKKPDLISALNGVGFVPEPIKDK